MSSSTPPYEVDQGEAAHEQEDREITPEETLCRLGSLSGEHSLGLSRLMKGGQPIPNRPIVTIETQINPSSQQKPFRVATTYIRTLPHDRDSNFLVGVDHADAHYIDHSECEQPSRLAVKDPDSRFLWANTFDNLGPAIEAAIDGAESMTDSSMTT